MDQEELGKANLRVLRAQGRGQGDAAALVRVEGGIGGLGGSRLRATWRS